MKLHACRRCGARFPTYRELQEHVTSHSNVCVTCNRVFSRQATLKAHKCKVGEFLCESCNRSYSTQTQLTRHKRETSCRHSLPPEAKRRKMTPPIEEMEQPPPPPLDDEQDSELQDVIRENWASIRTHTSHGPVQSRYNIKLTTSDTRTLELGHIFLDQTTAFKINLSFGFVLRNRTSGRYKFYHSSCNCCGRYLDEPSLITDADTFEIFLERIMEPDILKWALSHSGKYDLNVIKQFFVTYLLKSGKKNDKDDVNDEADDHDDDDNDDDDDETRFVIKRQNTFMCFSTKKLKFLDIINYLAPGFSYDKYLKAYGCELQKGHFPYEYMDDVRKLDDCALPLQEAFYSRLKNEGISDEDYARCHAVWSDNRMKTMRDFLVWYNNRDVVPFLEAIDKQFAFYQQQNIDMFKDGISVPGLTLLYLFNDLPPNTFFTVFNQTNSDLHQLVKDNIVGGPAIIFHRYHEKDITKIRDGELCRSIVGYDANALYLWALMQDMPTGWYTRRREEKQFRPQQAQPFAQMAVQWLTWEAAKNGCAIRHQVNGREKRIGKLPVDGWCANTRTAYQFHGCYFHGYPCCYDSQETNHLNGKTMAALLEKTRQNTTYLRRHVEVVEM